MDSDDIDVALSDMMGVTFANFFVDYCSNVKGLKVSQVAKIESNPEQSKHLETARTRVLGHELDFVNLRSEEYSQDSRIPAKIVCHEFYAASILSAQRDIDVWNALSRCYETRYHHQCPVLQRAHEER